MKVEDGAEGRFVDAARGGSRSITMAKGRCKKGLGCWSSRVSRGFRSPVLASSARISSRSPRSKNLVGKHGRSFDVNVFLAGGAGCQDA